MSSTPCLLAPCTPIPFFYTHSFLRLTSAQWPPVGKIIPTWSQAEHLFNFFSNATNPCPASTPCCSSYPLSVFSFKAVILRHRSIWLLRIGNSELLLDALVSYCNGYFFQYCLGGCNPFASYALDSCAPNPVCQNTTVGYGGHPSGNQG